MADTVFVVFTVSTGMLPSCLQAWPLLNPVVGSLVGLYPAFVLSVVPCSLHMQPGLCAVQAPFPHQAHRIQSNAHLYFFLSSEFGLGSQLRTFGIPFPSIFPCSCWMLLKTFSNGKPVTSWGSLLHWSMLLTLLTCPFRQHPPCSLSPPGPAVCNLCSFPEQTPFPSCHPCTDSLLKDVLFLLTFLMTLFECHQCSYV